MLCYLHPHLTNIPIWNTIMNIINFWEMVTFQHTKTHQNWLQLLLYQKMTKDVHYLVQWMRRSSTHIYLKLNQNLLNMLVMKWSHRAKYCLTKHDILSYLNIHWKLNLWKNIVLGMDIIPFLYRPEILIHNNFQMRF